MPWLYLTEEFLANPMVPKKALQQEESVVNDAFEGTDPTPIVYEDIPFFMDVDNIFAGFPSEFGNRTNIHGVRDLGIVRQQLATTKVSSISI